VDLKFLGHEKCIELQNQLLSGEFRYKDIKDSDQALSRISQSLSLSVTPQSGLESQDIAVFLFLANLHIDLNYDRIMSFAHDMSNSNLIQRLTSTHRGLALELELYLVTAFPEGSNRYFSTLKSSFQGKSDFLASLPFQLTYFYNIVRCSRLMARGQYFEARANLVQLHQLYKNYFKSQNTISPLPLFYLLRYHVVMGISAQSQGDYQLAKSSLFFQNRILNLYNHYGLRIAYDRRCLSLLIEQEHYFEALKLSRSFNLHTIKEMTTHATLIMVIQELLKLNLCIGHMEQVDHLTERLKQEIEKEVPGEEVVLPIEARCEIALMKSYDAEEAMQAIKPMLGQVKVSGYYNAEVVASIYLLRAFILKKDWISAEISSAQASHIGSMFGYGRDYLRILELRFISLMQLKRKEEASKIMSQSLAIAKKLELDSSALILSILHFSLKKESLIFEHHPLSVDRDQIEAAVHFCKSLLEPNSDSGNRLQYSLDKPSVSRTKNEQANAEKFNYIGKVFTKLPNGRIVKATIGETYLKVIEERLPIYSIPEGTVLFPRGRHLKIATPQLSTVEMELLKSFHEARDKGMTLNQIHTLISPNIDYHPLRHAPRVYAIISKINLAFKSLSIPVSLSKKQVEKETIYFLFGNLLLASKQAHNLSTYKLLSTKTYSQRRKNISSERKQSIEQDRPVKIIELLQENASKNGLSGSDLAKHFGITRQAIHRDIKKLCELGKIKISSKGRYSKIKLTPSE
jgi:biotin operon repressor